MKPVGHEDRSDLAELRDRRHRRIIGGDRVVHDELAVGAILVVDRRVVGHPDDVGRCRGAGKVGGEGEAAGSDPPGQQRIEIRLEQRRAPFVQCRDSRGVAVVAVHCAAGIRQAGRGDAAEMPEAEHAYFHARTS